MSTPSSAATALRISFAVFTLLSAACDTKMVSHPDKDGLTRRSWTEDVTLDDGTSLVVRRSVAFREYGSWAGDVYNAREAEATLAFTGRLAHLPVWSVPLVALLLFRDDETEEWVLVATATTCIQWSDHGAPQVLYLPDWPRTLYWEYRLGKQGEWREVPISKSSIGRRGNLLHEYVKDLGTTHVTAELRRSRQPDDEVAERFVTIQERPLVKCTPSDKGLEMQKQRQANWQENLGAEK